MVTPDPKVDGLLAQTTYRLASCWKIQRTDGAVYRYTAHDKELIVNGETYKPSGSLNMSASEIEGQLSTNNKTAVGAIDADEISDADLLNGKFRNALVNEYVVDWRYPWAGVILSSQYWVVGVKFTSETWELEMEGIISRLNSVPTISMSRTCRFNLGDTNCTVAVENFSSCMFQVTDVTTAGLDNRTKFEVDFMDAVDDYYKFGVVEWLSGDGLGVKSEIADQTGTTISLFARTTFEIKVGDKLQLVAGCDKLKSTCINKFNNFNNFGGFPDIPGRDRMVYIPERKTP